MLLLILPNAEMFKTLEARVAALLIPSDFKVDEALNAPVLLDEGKKLCGEAEINTYLDSLEKFTKQWYACRCDMLP